MSTIAWIVIAAAALLVIAAAVALVGRGIGQRRRHKAERIRDDARQQAAEIERREAIADETGARARVAQAEAEVKAAEAARLKERAEDHQSHAAEAREELDDKWRRADRMDPRTENADDGPDEAEHSPAREATDGPANSPAAESFTSSEGRSVR